MSSTTYMAAFPKKIVASNASKLHTPNSLDIKELQNKKQYGIDNLTLVKLFKVISLIRYEQHIRINIKVNLQ